MVRKRRAQVGAIGAVGTLLLTIAALTLPASAQAADPPWTTQRSGTSQPLYGVAFSSATAGWACGGGGVLLRTLDGGSTWKMQDSRTTQTLRAVTFVDAAKGWAVGGRGVIVHTTDGGATWALQASGTTQTLHAVAFADPTSGLAVGARGVVLRTTNGGATWTSSSPTRESLYDIARADASTVWAVGGKGTILKSTNSGATWSSQSSGVRTTLNAVASSDARTAWTAGSGGVVRATTDGGASWAAQSSGALENLDALVVVDGARVRTAGAAGTVRVTVDGGRTWSGEATGTTQSLYGAAWRAGRGWVVGAGGTILTYRPDTTPPVTSAGGLQADDSSGWTNAPVTVTLTANDDSGVAATFYTLDGGEQQAYTAPVGVSGEGRHLVTYWSVDSIGNSEAVRSGYVNIDTTSPTVRSDADDRWHVTDVVVRLTAADEGGSGVAATQYRPAGSDGWIVAAGDQFVVPARVQGAYVFDIRALDAAGNASPVGSCTVRVDATPPVTTAMGLGADKISSWSATQRTVALSATDGAGSGVSAIRYTVDGGSPQTYAGSFLVGGAGQHPVTYWSEDAAGNVEAVRTGWVNISDPYAQAENLAGEPGAIWRNGPVTVTISAHGVPGPLTIHYQVDGGERQEAGGPVSFVVSGAGRHTVVFYATDGNGFESLHQTGYVDIDMSAPQTTLQSAAPSSWVNHPVTLTFLAVDDASGVAATYSTLDGGDPVEGPSREVAAPADHSNDGRRMVTYWSADLAGNSGAPVLAVVRIDTRRPTTRAPYAAAVTRGQKARLRYVVRDAAPCAGTAMAKIVIKNVRGRVVKQLKAVTVKTGVVAARSFRCKLAAGKYRFFVYAVDAAGNTQIRVASNRLTVR